jgi:hypothetical protein
MLLDVRVMIVIGGTSTGNILVDDVEGRDV